MRIYLSYDPADAKDAEKFSNNLLAENPSVEFVQRPPAVTAETVPTAEAKEEIEKALSSSTIAICMVSEVTKDNQWVNFEMAAAEMQGRGIMGFFVEGDYVSPNEWPEFFRIRHNQYDVIMQGKMPKLNKAVMRAEAKGTQTNIFEP
ncbi:MAG: TIR domain-containing protein [SAR324 cluster bacterium]|nr:TIR domain-containing protein [SAR324 cluster bacterium]